MKSSNACTASLTSRKARGGDAHAAPGTLARHDGLRQTKPADRGGLVPVDEGRRVLDFLQGLPGLKGLY